MFGKTENRQVWIDFPYPKEIFLALHFDRSGVVLVCINS